MPEYTKHAHVKTFLTGLFASNIATEITAVALPLIALTVLGATDQEIVLLGVLESVIMILVLLPLGLIVDHQNRRNVLLVANYVTAGLLLLVALLYMLNLLSMAWIIFVMLGIRIMGAAFDNASFTVMPRLVPDRNLDEANGAYGSVRSVAELSGAGVGAIVLHTLGLVFLLVGNALLSLISVIFLWRLPKDRLKPQVDKGVEAPQQGEPLYVSWRHHTSNSFRDATAGLRIIASTPRLMRIVGSSVTSNMFATLLGVTEVVYIVRVLQIPAWAVGILFSIPAIGGVVGGLIVGWLTRAVGSVRMILVAQFLLSAPILLLPFATPGYGIALYILAWFCYSLSSVVYGASVASMTQRIIPDSFRGRVSASGSWMNAVAITIAGAAAAFLVEPLGTRTLVFIGVFGVYLSALWLVHPMFLYRSLPDAERIQ